MPDPDPRSEPHGPDDDGFGDLETVPTSRADVESAGRSCMAIVVMLTVILFLLAAWVALHAAGVAG